MRAEHAGRKVEPSPSRAFSRLIAAAVVTVGALLGVVGFLVRPGSGVAPEYPRHLR